jgi:hypothetical protein
MTFIKIQSGGPPCNEVVFADVLMGLAFQVSILKSLACEAGIWPPNLEVKSEVRRKLRGILIDIKR